MEMVIRGTTMILDEPSIIMSVAEIMVSSMHLTVWRTEMILPGSSIIKDDAEITVNETELDVAVKPKHA